MGLGARAARRPRSPRRARRPSPPGSSRSPGPGGRRAPPRRRASRARDEAEGAHLEDAAERLVRLPQPVDLLDHRLAWPPGRGSAPASRRRPRSPRAPRSSRSGARHRADLDHVAVDLDPERRRKALASAPAATRAAVSRALARSSTLRTSVWPNFSSAGEVGVAGARQVDLLDLGLDRPRVHPLLPVRVVAVGDQHGDRAAERAPVADARSGSRPRRSRSSSARRGRGRAGGAPCRGRAPRGRARGRRAGPRRSRPGRGRAIRRLS